MVWLIAHLVICGLSAAYLRRPGRVERARGMLPPLEKLPLLEIPDNDHQRDALYEPPFKLGPRSTAIRRSAATADG